MNSFELKKEIFQSQNSIIYEGVFSKDNSPIIVKILNKNRPSNIEISKFEFEYKICKNIQSDGIIKVYSFEKYNDTFAIIMEDFGGKSLNSILENNLDINKFLSLAIKISQALAQIHKENIVHKDINPSNILLNTENQILKLIDFGISNVLSKENPRIVSPNFLEGTIAYMSPEQTGRTNKNIDYRTDYYSLGVTFYEMITNQLPFTVKDPLELIHSHIAKLPVAPHEIRNDIPIMISNVILKLMSKNPEDRYQSAFGIVKDLTKCQDILNISGEIEYFEIGQYDISNRFEIPQKLYGRENDLEKLLNVFENLEQQKSQIAFVTGYSGVGKSALVNQVQSSVLTRKGRFISGKFDQLRKNIPYSSLIQAFEDLIKQILTESNEKINYWKQMVLDAVGPNGQVIINVLPQLELIIGKQPDIPELDSEKAQNRFNMVFQNFVNSLSSKDNPLVIFLDDLQWADFSTLKMIERLMLNDDINNILIIGAYRENEVSDTDLLITIINEIKNKGKEVNFIQLSPLDIKDISYLISDTLKADTPKIAPLAELCMKKTQGNPFFLSQFLKSLYQENLINYDTHTGTWTWDIDKIQQKEVTDNVLDLMTQKIKKLPKNTQEALKLAACIGNRFDINTLAIITEKALSATSEDLWGAVEEELIIPRNNNYKFVNDLTEGLDVTYKFLHDRIQQAAYCLILEDVKKNTHLKIGQLMLQNTPENIKEEKIFDIVNHLNIGIDLITDESSKRELLELNLYAGKKARVSNAHYLAYSYLKVALTLLNENSWDNEYDLTLALYIETAEVAYLNLDFQSMEGFNKIALEKSRSNLDKARVYEVKLKSLVSQNDRPSTVELGLFVLKLLGLKIPTNPSQLDVLLGLIKIRLFLIGKLDKDIYSLPEMKDPYKICMMRIISLMFTSVFITKPNLFPIIGLKTTELSFKYGGNVHSSSGYGMYAIVLFSFPFIKLGLNWAEIYKKSFEKSKYPEFKTIFVFSYYTCMCHHNTHLKDFIHKIYEGYLSGLEVGNSEYAALCLFIYSNNLYFMGRELSEVDDQYNLSTRTFIKLGQDSATEWMVTLHQIVLNLMGKSEDAHKKSGLPPEEELLHTSIDASVIINISFYNRTVLNYLFYNYKEAYNNLLKSRKCLEGVVSFIDTPIFYFYDSLVLMSAIDGERNKTRILLKVISNIRKLKSFAKYAPMNHLHKYYLVKAEICKYKKDDLNAVEYYEKAINLAKENEYIQEEALANELAGKFYLSRGREKIAAVYLKDSRYCYSKWGALAKVKHINEVYSQLFAKYSENTNKVLNVHSTATVATTMLETGSFDLASILKSSQAISREIQYDKLVEKLMNIIVESAGAQRVVLLLEKDNNYIIDAQYHTDNDTVEFLDDILFDASTSNEIIPSSIINYVIRTRETLVLFNASKEENFKLDTYVTNNSIKSAVCMPLIYQNKLKAILYLENNLTEGVFTPSRLKVLDMLSSQMVTSIENANTYSHLEDLVKQRTKELEELASHDTLTNLPNRRLFYEKIVHTLNVAKNTQSKVAIIFIDLDGFKAVNDNLGHEKGDLLLKEVARRLLSCIRECDTVSRLGGDEFTIILESIQQIEDVKAVALRILELLKKPVIFDDGIQANVTGSIGISMYPSDGDNAEILIKKSDEMMYIAKHNGKNNIKFYENV